MNSLIYNFKTKIFEKNNTKIYIYFVILFLILQIIFWYRSENIKPNLGIVPNVPTLATVKAFSFGDEEFYFRYKGFRIQNTGDTFGRFSPLKNYNYSKLSQWFYLLDTLDNKSNYIPSLAAYYYSLTQNHKDTIYIINYLKAHADKNPKEKWWWYYQAMYLADSVYNDKDLAIEMAKKLKDYSPDSAPIWTKQMLATLLANKGDKCQAIQIMNGIIEDYDRPEGERKLTERELNFMQFFIKQKIEELKKDKNFNSGNCLK